MFPRRLPLPGRMLSRDGPVDGAAGRRAGNASAIQARPGESRGARFVAAEERIVSEVLILMDVVARVPGPALASVAGSLGRKGNAR